MDRMGGKRTFLLACGAFLGTLAMSGLIHVFRQKNSSTEGQYGRDTRNYQYRRSS